jgi:hypothetical protein
MLRTLMLALLALFGLFALLTLLCQIQGGSMDGQAKAAQNDRAPDSEPSAADPRLRAEVSRRGRLYALLAAACLLGCFALGAVMRMG